MKHSLWLIGLAAAFPTSTIDVRAAELKAFESKTYGYLVQYPKEWYLDETTSTNTFHIDSFPPNKAVRAVHIPPGGAEIMLAPIDAVQQAEMPHTLADWMAMDNRRGGLADERTLEIEMAHGRLSISEVRRNCCAVPPYSESVAWYFQLEGRPFKALLIYWKGDPKVDKLRQTLRRIVASLRLTRK